MRTIEVKGYEYKELSEEAQEKARDWWREASAGDSFYSEAVIDDAKEMGKFMGLDIKNVWWSGFSSQGDGACFDATWHASDVDAPGLKAEAPRDTELHRIADLFALIANEYPNASFSVKQSGHYQHKYCTEFDVTMSEEDDIDEKQAIEDEKALIEVARDYMEWIYRTLEKEDEYQDSDEQVADTIQANEYLFTEDGKRTYIL